jgi:flagellin
MHAGTVEDGGVGEERLLQALPAEVRLKNQALRDVNDGLSMTQVAEDALSRSVELLHSVRSLLEERPEGRGGRSLVMTGIVDELERIARDARFNGWNLLTDELQGVLLRTGVGDSHDQLVPVAIGRLDVDALGLRGVNLEDVSAGNPVDISGAMDRIDRALTRLADLRQDVQDMQSRFSQAVFSLATVTENVAAAKSNHRDADAVARTSHAILSQVGTAIQTQGNQPAELVRHLLG